MNILFNFVTPSSLEQVVKDLYNFKNINYR